MARMNHQRPALRFLDNIRRELDQEARKAVLPADAARPERRMPLLAGEDAELARAWLDCATALLDSEHDYLLTLPPLAPKSARGKMEARRRDLEEARATFEAACQRMITRALEEALTGERRRLWKWIKRFEARLIAARDVTGLGVLFDEGLKPALARVERTLAG